MEEMQQHFLNIIWWFKKLMLSNVICKIIIIIQIIHVNMVNY